jgi:hypothetical protein
MGAVLGNHFRLGYEKLSRLPALRVPTTTYHNKVSLA